MARYWASKRVFTTVGEDTRTLSLHVLCKACFGHSFQFEGHDDRDHNSPSATFRNTLLHIMENALLILALGPKFFIQPWLPLPGAWKKLGDACDHFRDHLTKLYAQKLHSLRNRPEEKDSTLMASLIRASQTGEKGQILTESEIYGNLFVISFAGHDTTSHLITFAMYVALYPLSSADSNKSVSSSWPIQVCKIGLLKSCDACWAPDLIQNGTTTQISQSSNAAWLSSMRHYGLKR